MVLHPRLICYFNSAYLRRSLFPNLHIHNRLRIRVVLQPTLKRSWTPLKISMLLPKISIQEWQLIGCHLLQVDISDDYAADSFLLFVDACLRFGEAGSNVLQQLYKHRRYVGMSVNWEPMSGRNLRCNNTFYNTNAMIRQKTFPNCEKISLQTAGLVLGRATNARLQAGCVRLISGELEGVGAKMGGWVWQL